MADKKKQEAPTTMTAAGWLEKADDLMDKLTKHRFPGPLSEKEKGLFEISTCLCDAGLVMAADIAQLKKK